MNIQIYIQNTLLVTIVVYFSQGSVYPQGSLLSQAALVIMLSISILYFIRTLFSSNRKPMFYKIWTLLLLSNLFLYIFTADLSNSLHFGKLKGLVIIALPFYPFYFFARKGILKADTFMWLFIVMLPIVISKFYFERASIISLRSHSGDNVVNNIAYFFVFLFPFLYFFRKRKIIAFIATLILIYFIIEGAKRGALLTGALGLLIFSYYNLKNIDSKFKIQSYLFSGIAFFVITFFAIDFYQNNEYLVRRMDTLSDGNGFSGRDYIYANIFDAWYSADSPVNILFGFGFASSLILSKTGTWAHNDWLEGLVGMGLFGVVLYALLFYSSLRMMFKNDWSFDKKMLFLTLIVIWLSTTLFSMNYYNATYSLFQYIVIGYLVGSKSRTIE